MKKLFILMIIFLLCISCTDNKGTGQKISTHKDIKLSLEDSVKFKDFVNKAYQYGIYTQKYQAYLDSALMIKPNAANIWQQKAMPLYKERKYSLGKPFLAKAVQYDPEHWLDYSAFMKCLFSKEYEESITEFMDAKKRFGDTYVMDHTYNFYIGLDYLQLNMFQEAKKYLELSKMQQLSDFPDDPPHEACHYLDWFYLGIVDYELENYEAAITSFDNCLLVYKNLADAMYYKAICRYKLNEIEESEFWMQKANENSSNTFNEDQVFYEVYPYQHFHKLRTAN